MRFRLSVVLSDYRVGATKTAIRYKVTRQFVYFWIHRYHDDDIRSLADRSHRPSHHPNQHSDLEIKWIKDLRRRNLDMGLIDFWLRYLAFYEEHSTFSSTKFLMECIRFFPFRIQCVQTDNGSEFTNRLRSEKKTLFEEALKANGIDYHPIRPAMPRHNGKVERSHREDQKRLYDKTTFYSLQDADTQLKKYLKKSNNRPMRPLGYLSPNDMISILLNV